MALKAFDELRKEVDAAESAIVVMVAAVSGTISTLPAQYRRYAFEALGAVAEKWRSSGEEVYSRSSKTMTPEVIKAIEDLLGKHPEGLLRADIVDSLTRTNKRYRDAKYIIKSTLTKIQRRGRVVLDPSTKRLRLPTASESMQASRPPSTAQAEMPQQD